MLCESDDQLPRVVLVQSQSERQQPERFRQGGDPRHAHHGSAPGGNRCAVQRPVSQRNFLSSPARSHLHGQNVRVLAADIPGDTSEYRVAVDGREEH